MSTPSLSTVAEQLYRADLAPWEIGRPQPCVDHLIGLGVIRGNVLDAGCGTGWHAIAAARAGCTAVGIDASLTAIVRARRNARTADVPAKFRLGHIPDTLGRYEDRFDTVIDSKLYDNIAVGEPRHSYLTALHRAMTPGGRLILFGFGPGSVNGIHNYLLDEPDHDTALPAAGFTITYTGVSTYLLDNAHYEPLCPDCPRKLSGEYRHIPVTEIHATKEA